MCRVQILNHFAPRILIPVIKICPNHNQKGYFNPVLGLGSALLHLFDYPIEKTKNPVTQFLKIFPNHITKAHVDAIKYQLFDNFLLTLNLLAWKSME